MAASKKLTARQLNRATLGRQLLLRRESLDVVEAAHRVVALQAQEPPSPYLALWNRLIDFDPPDLDRAFADHAVVKATLMRIALHAVDATDYPAFHEAMQPTLRAARLNDRRFRRAGLSIADAEALLTRVLEFAEGPRTNAEAEAWLDERLGVTPKPGVWWAFRQFGPFVHSPTGGPWSFGPRPSYVAARDQQRTGLPAATSRDSVRPRSRTSPSSPWSTGRGPVTLLRLFAAPSSPWKDRTAPSCSMSAVACSRPRTRQPRRG